MIFHELLLGVLYRENSSTVMIVIDLQIQIKWLDFLDFFNNFEFFLEILEMPTFCFINADVSLDLIVVLGN